MKYATELHFRHNWNLTYPYCIMNPGPKLKSVATVATAKGNTHQHAAALAEAQLREVALRITPARIKVLAALLEAKAASAKSDVVASS